MRILLQVKILGIFWRSGITQTATRQVLYYRVVFIHDWSYTCKSVSPKTYHTCEPSNKHSIGLLCYGCKWSIYAYWFFKYLSDNNKCDKPSDCHLWCINRSHLIFRNELKRLTGNYSITNIRKLRAVFGTYLLLGLEFLIASDILKTVLEPTLKWIGHFRWNSRCWEQFCLSFWIKRSRN